MAPCIELGSNFYSYPQYSRRDWSPIKVQDCCAGGFDRREQLFCQTIVEGKTDRVLLLALDLTSDQPWVLVAFVPAETISCAQPLDIEIMLPFLHWLRAEASSCVCDWIAAAMKKVEQSPQLHWKGWEHILCRTEGDNQHTMEAACEDLAGVLLFQS